MKKYFSLLFAVVLVLLVSACGAVGGKKHSIKVDDTVINYEIDAPYYGKIVVGESTMDMLSTDDMLKESGFKKDWTKAFGYEEEKTKDKFYYNDSTSKNYFEVEFSTHSNIYEENGCSYCRESLSKNVELPKGITYNSTIDDVIKAYGEPDSKDDSFGDSNYEYSRKTDGEELGVTPATKLEYNYEGETAKMNLYLYFSKSKGKLHRIHYQITVHN